MKKQASGGSPRARGAQTKPVSRKDLTVPLAARRIEKKIASILRGLITSEFPSCTDKRFVAAYGEVHRLFARYQREVLAAYPRRVTCGRACGVCCNHWPEDTYSFEVLAIADYLHRRRPGHIPAIRAGLRKDMDCLARIQQTFEKRLSDPNEKKRLDGIDPYDVVLSTFYQFNRPCPLLDKNGSCGIYRIRPFTCRVYVSFSSPDLCKPDSILGDDALTYLLDLDNCTTELFDRIHFMYDVFDGDTSMRSMLYRALGTE